MYSSYQRCCPSFVSLRLESSTSQLEAHISSIEVLLSVFEHLHVLKISLCYQKVVAALTEAQAVRTTTDKEIAVLIEQYKSYQDQFKQLCTTFPFMNATMSILHWDNPLSRSLSKCHHPANLVSTMATLMLPSLISLRFWLNNI